MGGWEYFCGRFAPSSSAEVGAQNAARIKVVFLLMLNVSEESLLNLWHLEKKLLQLLHVDSTGSPTWFLSLGFHCLTVICEGWKPRFPVCLDTKQSGHSPKASRAQIQRVRQLRVLLFLTFWVVPAIKDQRKLEVFSNEVAARTRERSTPSCQQK